MRAKTESTNGVIKAVFFPFQHVLYFAGSVDWLAGIFLFYLFSGKCVTYFIINYFPYPFRLYISPARGGGVLGGKVIVRSVSDVALLGSARLSLRRTCTYYFPRPFFLPFSCLSFAFSCLLNILLFSWRD